MTWTAKLLSEILDQSGHHRAGDQDLPVLSITMKHGLVDQADKFKKRVASSDTSNYRIAYKNELVVGFPIDEGVLGFQTKYPAGIVSPAYGIWKLKNATECHIPYLERFLRSPHARSLYASRMQGAVARRRSLTKSDFLNLEIPFPPLDDQIRIAHLLGKVEGLIAQRKQHLQQLDDLLKSVFLAMFGPNNPDYDIWPLVEIRDLAAKHKGAMRTGPFGSNLLHSEFTAEGDVAVLGIDNAVQNRFAWREKRFITQEKYQELGGYRVYPGDVIVTIMGTIGRSAVVPDDIPLAINTKHLAAITLNREMANPLFLSYSIHSSPFILNQFRGKNRGAIMSGLNLGIIKETKLKRPSIELQNQFAETHRRVDDLKSMYLRGISDLEALYGALGQKAFKGELDLSRVPLPADQGNQIHSEPVERQADRSSPPAVVATPADVINNLVQAAQPQGDEMLARWFSRYLTNTSTNASLGSSQFLEAAWQTLQETQLDNDGETLALTLDDYDALKDWVFKKLASSELSQTFDGDSNRVALQGQSADWGTW